MHRRLATWVFDMMMCVVTLHLFITMRQFQLRAIGRNQIEELKNTHVVCIYVNRQSLRIVF